VAQFQQMTAADPELACQAGGGLALGDPAQDQHDFGGAVMRAGQNGLGEGIEDAAAVPAPVVDDWLAVAAMDNHAIGLSAAWAGKSSRMQPAEHRLVTLRFVHEVNDGKIHGLLRERPIHCAASREKREPLILRHEPKFQPWRPGHHSLLGIVMMVAAVIAEGAKA
jgi:hypothetical protein